MNMEKNKKYQVDFDMGVANYFYTTKSGNRKISRFRLFIDSIGVKIFTRNGVEYLTEQNSEVL